jgi:hypothetical protein
MRMVAVFLDKREIRLTKTKNGSHKTVQLNADAVTAIRSLQRPDQRSKDPVLPREGPTFDNRSWLNPCFEDADRSLVRVFQSEDKSPLAKRVVKRASDEIREGTPLGQ